MRAWNIAATAAAALVLPATATAQTVVAPEAVRPQDVITSPLADVNLMKRPVPVVLQKALAKPYDLSGIKSCLGLETAISDLNAALGDDIDVAQAQTSDQMIGNGAGAVAKSLLSSFIPFRSVVRVVSGAQAHEQLWQRALYAGSVRRAFLKGMGEQGQCGYPARAATPEVLASLAAQRNAAKTGQGRIKRAAKPTTGGPVALTMKDADPAPASLVDR